MSDKPTPCLGKHALFDSIEPADHQQARALCLACPLTRACSKLLEDTRANGGIYGHPEGTWAGQLVLPPTEAVRKRLAAISRAERTAAEDARYTITTARQAHSAYSMGDRSEWATTGHRVYDRRRKAQNRTAVA